MGEFLDGRPPVIDEQEAAQLTKTPEAARLMAALSLRAYNDFEKIYYDDLSHLPNNRAMNDVIDSLEGMFATQDEVEWVWFDHEIDRVGVAYIDLDEFKQINDKFGHPVGDNVIVAISGLLEVSLRRAGDMAFRSHRAGDEFVVILPFHTPVDHGDIIDSIETPYEQVLQSFLDTLEALHWAFEDHLTSDEWMGIVGASVGKATYNPALKGQKDNEDLRAIIKKAEKNMRRKKEARNKAR